MQILSCCKCLISLKILLIADCGTGAGKLLPVASHLKAAVGENSVFDRAGRLVER